MTQVYDKSIQLTPDCKGLEIKWVTIVGVNPTTSEPRETSGSGGSQAGGKLVPDPGLWIESKNLKYVLNSDKWGARILTHPLIKLYLEQKWRKIQWFFWVAFLLEVSRMIIHYSCVISTEKFFLICFVLVNAGNLAVVVRCGICYPSCRKKATGQRYS